MPEVITQETIDFHVSEWAVEMNGRIYFDGCPDAWEGCPICSSLDEPEIEN